MGTDEMKRANTRDRTKLPDPETLLEDILSKRGWDLRDGQMEMALNVGETIEGYAPDLNGITISAPVGTGKTLGYLVGALPYGHRILVCTSTKALQNQIMESELPNLAKDLKEMYDYDLTYSVLKGKSNYVCVERVEEILEGIFDDDDPDLFALNMASELTKEDKEILGQIRDRVTAAITDRDLSKMDCEDLISELPHGIKPLIRSSRGCSGCRTRWWGEGDEGEIIYDPFNNLGSGIFNDDDDEPSRFPLDINGVLETSSCAYRTAVALSYQADIVVMNTSLLAADLNKCKHVGPFTPTQIRGSGVIIVDEAHHLPNVITDSMRHDLDFSDLHKEMEVLTKRISKRFSKSTGDAIKSRIDDLPDMVDEVHHQADEITDTYGAKTSRKKVTQELDRLAMEIRVAAELGRAESDRMKFAGEIDERDYKTMSRSFYNLTNDLKDSIDTSADHLRSVSDDDDFVYDVSYMVDDETGNMSIQTVPLDLSFFNSDIQRFANQKNSFLQEGWNCGGSDSATTILCSGTITSRVGDTMGLTDDVADYVKCTSPFDPLRCRLCIPGDLEAPNHSDWFEEAYEYARQAIMATEGKTLFLTTSKNNTNLFFDRVMDDFGSNYTVLSQYSMSRDQLIETFRSDENSILVATRSYWEGIDIPGRALSLVIMDKCMFPVVDDIVFSARTKWVEKNGGNGFNDVMVDHAATMFSQGFGRAIRKSDDMAGVLVLDSRIVDKSYGSKILSIIEPETPKTVLMEPFLEWLRFVNENPGAEEVPELDSQYWTRVRPKRKARKSRSGVNRYLR